MAKNIYIETYGCQMNLCDTEIIQSILCSNGMNIVTTEDEADIILMNTCSVRDNAEKKIIDRVQHLKRHKKKNPAFFAGIVGCMAQRLKESLIEHDLIKLVAGPDEYRKLPDLIEKAAESAGAVAVGLSLSETYYDIEPIRQSNISAWIAVMRGCNNFCSYCIVPYTRGRERSRSYSSILTEVAELARQGYREITLLGQNVNSYNSTGPDENDKDFPDLLTACAEAAPGIRFRFTTSHPKDISNKLIETISAHDNICNHIHLAMQSGSDEMLKRMNRKYTIGHFFDRIDIIRKFVPDCAITTDIIAGYPGETMADHRATMQAMNRIRYDGAFMFRYSTRPGTAAAKLEDDVPEAEKIRRLNQIIDLQNTISHDKNEDEIGRVHTIMVEGPSKRNPEEWMGRTGTNKVVIFPKPDDIVTGDFIRVMITKISSATLFGKAD